MKSIYEAAVAYGREHQGTVNIEDFEAGANYVLDEVEYILEDNSIGDSEKICNELLSLIEQLKK